MIKPISKTLSYLLHPVFLPGFLMILLKIFAPLPLLYSFYPQKLFLALLFFVVGYTTVIPLGFVYLLKRLGGIKSYQLQEKAERPKVFLFVSGFYIALAYFMYSRGNLFIPTAVILIAMAINILGLFLMNFWDKISIHTAGMGGVLGILMGIFKNFNDYSLLPVILIVLVILGIIGSARLYLGSHNLRQVLIGSVWGFMSGFLPVLYFIKFY